MTDLLYITAAGTVQGPPRAPPEPPRAAPEPPKALSQGLPELRQSLPELTQTSTASEGRRSSVLSKNASKFIVKHSKNEKLVTKSL